MNRSDKPKPRKPNPVARANVFSKFTFWWLRHFLRLGMRGEINPDEIYENKKSLNAKKTTETFDRYWQEELKRKNPSVMRFLFREYGCSVLFWGLAFSFTETLARVIQPLCLGRLVSYFAPGQTEFSKNDAYIFAAGIVASSAYQVVTFHPFILWIFEMGASIRLGCSGLIYKKALSLPRAAVSEGLNGRVINILSNDLTRFEIAMAFFHDIWKGPLEAFLFGYFIYMEIGISAIIGIAFILSFIPLQAYIGRKSARLRLKTAKRTDYRVKIMNEIILGIQVIKMYAWETSFARMVNKIRRKEISAVRGTAYIRATLFSFGMVSRLSIFLSLLAYIYFGNYITARKVYIVSSYFGILNQSMVYFWPLALTAVAEGYISVKRVQEFLLMSDMKPHINPEDLEFESPKKKRKPKSKSVPSTPVVKMNGLITSSPNTPPQEGDKLLAADGTCAFNESAEVKGIRLQEVTASWITGDAGTVGIKSVTLNVPDASLCAVVGQVGAGKSTLLHVILGELTVDSGQMRVDGTVSYAAQEAWLFEGSIRANILFIEEYDERRYKQVVRACALERDFKLLPYGDSTVVGERGISLSGGQKARVNLARAVYKRADIYLLDDPLSAVDTHVGKHIFQECIQRFLRDKICVLITHQLQYLKEVKNLVVMNSARVEVQGTFADLRKMKIEALMSSPDESGRAHEEELKKADRQRSTSCSSINTQMTDDDTDRAEQQGRGAVSWSVYKQFLDSVRNGYYIVGIVLFFILAQLGLTGLDFYVSQWVNWEEHIATQHSDEHDHPEVPVNVTLEATVEQVQRTQYVQWYAILMAVSTYVYVHRTFAFFSMCLQASINLHDSIFRGISRATMFFYNNNPSGRILNRFSKDISSIDTLIPPALMDCLASFLEFFAIVIIVVIVNVWLLIPTIVMCVLFYFIRKCYINTARSVKRIESISLSPIYSHANATLQGLSTIRAFKANDILQNEFYNHIDANTGAWYLKIASTRAFALWLDVVCLFYITVVTFSFVVFDIGIGNSGNVGLAILQCINMIGMCQWGMRQTAEIENQMTCVERVMEYANLPAEPALETEEANKPPADWPQSGALRFEKLNFRYSPAGAFVLRDVDVSIEAGEKIGIVGRTGAGKSSIIQALFRLAQLDGVIRIDGVDTNTLGLHDLRKQISIIPQDPVLFSGTLRFNLDPFAERSDVELWSALEQVELRPFVVGMVGGLDCKMSDGGSNFSMGQRQLVCLARAILRRNKILILDEATANVDPETDRLIQATIRSRFSECTVLTIAHRLHTVMDNDRVLVVDAGRAVEFGHPFELLQMEGGFLRQLVDQTGSETAEILTNTAMENFNSNQSPERAS